MEAVVVPEIDGAEELRGVDLDAPFLADFPPGGLSKGLPQLDMPASAAVFAVAVRIVNTPAEQQPALLEDKAAHAHVDDGAVLVVYLDAPFMIPRIALRWLMSCPAIISVTRVTVSFPRSECMP